MENPLFLDFSEWKKVYPGVLRQLDVHPSELVVPSVKNMEYPHLHMELYGLYMGYIIWVNMGYIWVIWLYMGFMVYMG